MTHSTLTPSTTFTRAEVMAPGAKSAWHVSGTPLCLAFHLFVTIDMLEHIEFVRMATNMGCLAVLRLHWASWFRPWRRYRAWKTARYIIRTHKAAGTLISVQLR